MTEEGAQALIEGIARQAVKDIRSHNVRPQDAQEAWEFLQYIVQDAAQLRQLTDIAQEDRRRGRTQQTSTNVKHIDTIGHKARRHRKCVQT